MKQKNAKNNFKSQKNLANQFDEANSEKFMMLIQLLNQMYYHGLKKFPNNTSLRISYAFFLIEKLNMKQ